MVEKSHTNGVLQAGIILKNKVSLKFKVAGSVFIKKKSPPVKTDGL